MQQKVDPFNIAQLFLPQILIPILLKVVHSDTSYPAWTSVACLSNVDLKSQISYSALLLNNRIVSLLMLLSIPLV